MIRLFSRTGEKGIALVSVLWVLAILSVMAAAALSTGRLFAILERNNVRTALADSVADAGVARAVLGLLDNRPEFRWRADGMPQTFAFAGGPVQVTVQDELGKFDLNAIDESQFKSLFMSGGLADEAADKLAARAVAWRSEASQSSSASPPSKTHTPRYGPYQSVDEIKLLDGMTAEVFQTIEPALTVYSKRPTIDPEVAPREALMALPGVDRKRIEEILEARVTGESASESGGSSGTRTGVLDINVPLSGRVFTITVLAEHEGAQARRIAVVQLTPDAAQPYLVLDWR